MTKNRKIELLINDNIKLMEENKRLHELKWFLGWGNILM